MPCFFRVAYSSSLKWLHWLLSFSHSQQCAFLVNHFSWLDFLEVCLFHCFFVFFFLFVCFIFIETVLGSAWVLSFKNIFQFHYFLFFSWLIYSSCFSQVIFLIHFFSWMISMFTIFQFNNKEVHNEKGEPEKEGTRE